MGVETGERLHTWERTRSLTGEQTEDVVQMGNSKDQMGVETVDRSHTQERMKFVENDRGYGEGCTTGRWQGHRHARGQAWSRKQVLDWS